MKPGKNITRPALRQESPAGRDACAACRKKYDETILSHVRAREDAEDALGKIQERFRVIIRNSPAFFFSQDRALRYTWASHLFKNMPEHLILGKTDEEVFSPEEASCLTEYKRRVLATGLGIRIEFRINLNGEDCVYDISLEPYLDPRGVIVGINGSGYDITVQKQLEEIFKGEKETFEKQFKENSDELVDAYRQLGKTRRLSDIGLLAATVAHELRNPLAAIHMAAFNLYRKSSNAALKGHFDVIEKKINESDQIINNLLFYSRIKPPQYQPVNIVELLGECIGVAESRYARKVYIAHELTCLNGVGMEADPLQLKEVFSNIINNAVDAVIDKPGKVWVKGGVEEDFVVVHVVDTGAGLDEALVQKVFDPFFTTKAQGTGLGLPVCKQIVALHDGGIDFVSKKGEGTTVTVRLPVRRENHA